MRAGVGAGDEPGEEGPGERQVGGVVPEQQRAPSTPAASGTPKATAKTSRSGQSRRSVSRIRRNRRNRTSIVARIADDGELHDQGREQELFGREERGPAARRCRSFYRTGETRLSHSAGGDDGILTGCVGGLHG